VAKLPPPDLDELTVEHKGWRQRFEEFRSGLFAVAFFGGLSWLVVANLHYLWDVKVKPQETPAPTIKLVNPQPQDSPSKSGGGKSIAGFISSNVSNIVRSKSSGGSGSFIVPGGDRLLRDSLNFQQRVKAKRGN
jgi:hypothetical protein